MDHAPLLALVISIGGMIIALKPSDRGPMPPLPRWSKPFPQENALALCKPLTPNRGDDSGS